MENIRRFQASTGDRLDRLCADWFKYAIVYSGASITDDDTDGLQNLFDMTEFRPATPERGSPPPESSLNRRKRRRSPPSGSRSQANSEAGPSSSRRRPHEPAGDHDIAMSWQRAEYEAASQEAEEQADDETYMEVDLNSQPRDATEPSLPTPTPPQVDGEGRFTSASKGKGRS
ncbi:hypothetical protein FRC12_023483 [Ceratobasidium sp. 428]|nr:hypothetical protein FRC12_023483 [Ceratobasidium sp. 428]